MTTQRIIVLSDVHLPFHAPNAVELAIQVIKVWQPDRVIFNGDIMDFYAVSTHDKNPERLKNGGLQTELEQWYELADKVRSAAPAECACAVTFGEIRRYTVCKRWSYRHCLNWGDSALRSTNTK